MFSTEKGIDTYLTARGQGWSMQVSSLCRYFNLSPDDIRRMDEIQIQNRMADLPRLMAYERRNTSLAMWGGKSDEEGRGRQPRKRGR